MCVLRVSRRIVVVVGVSETPCGSFDIFMFFFFQPVFKIGFNGRMHRTRALLKLHDFDGVFFLLCFWHAFESLFNACPLSTCVMGTMFFFICE